ncbi:hypothetical protein N0V94_008355 [Neodidymelliopsis sp. IMI 364377]|nr:hypothetical protein N0V94_008355 [Neodidymelliopsis sp. IMI 364377]
MASVEEISGKFQLTYSYFDTTDMHMKIGAFLSNNHCWLGPRQIDPLDTSFEDGMYARNATRKLGFHLDSLACFKMCRLMTGAFAGARGHYHGETPAETRLLKSIHQLALLEQVSGPCASACKNDRLYAASRLLERGQAEVEVVFAAQMLWDIQQEVDPLTESVDYILLRVGKDFAKLYVIHSPTWCSEEFRTRLPLQHKRIYDQWQFIELSITTMEAFQIGVDREERSSDLQFPVQGFRLLRHIPLLAGQIINTLRYEYQESFTDIASDQGHILTAMHFYHAAKQSGALPTAVWEDMQWFIDHQDLDHVFAGDLPTKNGEYVGQFCRAFGLNPAKFVRNRKPVKAADDVQMKRGQVRRLDYPSAYLRTIYNVKGENVKSYSQLTGVGRITAMEDFGNAQLDDNSSHGQPANVGYLITAKEAYGKDEMAISFDIVEFNTRCSRLLRSVRNLCLEEAPEDYPASLFANEAGVNIVLAELLRDLTGCPRQNARMWPKAVNLLRELIERDGRTCNANVSARMEMTTMRDVPCSGCEESDTAIRPSHPKVEDQSSGSGTHTSLFVEGEGLEVSGDSNTLGKGAELDTSVP